MTETVQLHCLGCKHHWEIEAPIVDDEIHIGMFDDLCPNCEEQGEVEDSGIDTRSLTSQGET